MSEVSKGIVALRKHALKPVKITVEGDVFYFKKLTVGDEDEIKKIIFANQDENLKPPKVYDDDASTEVISAYYKELDAYSDKATKQFRKLTCVLMKYILTDEHGNPFFNEDDDIFDVVNNVYAERFFKAYGIFKGENSGGVAEAESRFQN